MEQLAGADLEVRLLLRRLARSIASQQVITSRADPDLVNRLQPQLEDTAHNVLLGLHPEAAPLYVSPDEREQQGTVGIAAAVHQLEQDGYPGLACDLEAATARLKSCGTFQLLGSLTEAETGAAPALPLTEHAPLLGMLLGLAGTCPSLRLQRFSFQLEAGIPAAVDNKRLVLGEEAAATVMPAPIAAVPLSTRVFTVAPDPYALTDGSAAVAVLLPQELGLPTEAFAGSEDVQDLAEGLDSRPVWIPTAAAALLPPRSAAWLPVPTSLLEMQRDSRRGLPPGPLGLPLSLLSMSDAPGSCTMFSADVAAAWDGASDGGDAASADSVQPQVPASFGITGAGCDAAGSGVAAERQLGLSCQLWSLAEAELAQQALLALQGISSSLLRLQALLATPGALPRRSIAGLLQSLAVAGELRQRLHKFVAAFSSDAVIISSSSSIDRPCRGRCSGTASDPVQQAFAMAVTQVLQRQSAALQQLEQQDACSWVQTVTVGRMQGRRCHSRTPTLLQVALHTRRLQLQLRSLADLCCCSVIGAVGVGEELAERQAQQGSRWLWQDGFPGGTKLLDYLYRRANEADDADSPMLRFLFAQAIQPYLCHMHVWAFTPHAVSCEFSTAGDKELFTLDFLPPDERQASTLPVVPVDPPAFLQPLHAAFMRSGSQLRLLHSLEQHGRHLVYQLSGIGEQEVRQRQRGRAAGGEAAGARLLGKMHCCTSFSAVPGGASEVAEAAGIDAAGLAEPREPWITLACSSALTSSGNGGTADGSQGLHMSSNSLRQAVEISQEQDSIRTAAVNSWLGSLALQRRLADHVAATEQVGRFAAQQEQVAERASWQAAVLSCQQSSKAVLLQEQQAAVAERRARRAAEQAQQEAADRRMQTHAALREHSTAVAELEQALSEAALGSMHPLPPMAATGAHPQATGGQKSVPGETQQPAAAAAQVHQPEAAAAQVHQPEAAASRAQQHPAPGTAAIAAHLRPPAGMPTLKTRSRQHFKDMQQQQQQDAAPSAAADQAQAQGTAGGAGAARSTSTRQPLLPRAASFRPGAPSLPSLPYVVSAVLQHQLSIATSAGEQEEGGGNAVQDALAPLSAVLETNITHSVLSQYRVVSKACIRLFLDEFKVLEHLDALRRFFFQGAGDWAEALVHRLSTHADSLLPLVSHQADAMLEDAMRGTSVEGDPYAAHLRIKMLPGGTSAILAQVGAIHVGTPQRRARSFWSSQHTVTLAPTQLDALDCITLYYQVGWPLSAVLTEDTLQGYAAVFSMMVRLRRVEQLLRGLALPLAAQAKSSAELLLSEEDADRAHRRIQALRAFRFGAAQFVAVVQAYLQSRTTGDAWVHLLAKLMVSSEEVAAALISRQPSAPITGLLSRMNSLGPTGKAAHKLAQQMSRALSSSIPGSPTAAAAAAGCSTGQLARFNSLLSAAGVGSAANSAANTPRAAAAAAIAAGTKSLSRFASRPSMGSPFAGAAVQAGSSRQAWDASGASSPTAAATSRLSSRTSLTSALLGQAAAEATSAATNSSDPDTAAWAEHFQRSQQGIADLQELLDLHRCYVRQASEDCLTFGGSRAVREAVEGCLQSLVTFAFRLQGAVRSCAGRRLEETWTQALRLDGTWSLLAAAMADFEDQAQQLQELLRDMSSKSVLAELQLDFNGWYAGRRRQQARQAAMTGNARACSLPFYHVYAKQLRM